MGWVDHGLGRDFSVFGRLGWVHYSKSAKHLKGFINAKAFKARLDQFWLQHAVKYDFTADLTGIGNRSEEVMK